MSDFDVIVIGAGIGGMTASIYLKRANLNILLLEKSIPGGQINRSSLVENYPGFVKIDGPTLAMNVYEQVTNLNINYQYGDVKEIIKNNSHFIVKTSEKEYNTKSVIIATGRYPKELGLENEKELVGHGISYCALCDGMFFKGNDVAIVGGGNSALEEALYLSNICTKVYIIHRRDTFKADKLLVDKIINKGNIIIRYNSQIQSLKKSENKLSSITLDNGEEIKISGLFIYIGNIPDTKCLEKLDIKLEDDYIIVNNKMMTNINGIFACGDVIKKDTYQLTTAIGEAATAAINVSKYLEKVN